MTVPSINPSYVSDGVNPFEELSGSVSDPLPTGIIIFHASSVVPSGWLSCNGASVSKTIYANLFTLLGTNAFGTDTSTDFFVPNLNARFARGVSNTSSIGSTGGVSNHAHGNVTISPVISTVNTGLHDHDVSFSNVDHSHSNTNNTNANANDGDHNHGINAANTNAPVQPVGTGAGGAGTTVNAGHTHGINAPSTNGGGGTAHNWGSVSTGNISAGVTGHNHTISSNSANNHNHSGGGQTSVVSSSSSIPLNLVVQFIIKT